MTQHFVTTAYDAIIHGQPAFEDRRDAVLWAVAHADEFPGLKVVERTVVTTERTVWKHRIARAA